MIANLRAEPTTEYIKDKNDSDQQPYYLFPWGIVHNGTIANDREIRTHKHPSRIDSTAIVESLLKKSLATPPLDNFVDSIQELKGSFAILGINMLTMDTIYLACNYRPVWYAETPLGIFFASAREYFPDGFNPRMVTPYSIMIFTRFSDQTEIDAISLYRPPSQKALVICSGGLDSTVAASWAIWKGLKTELIHFRYGSRAEGPEVQAIQKIAEHLKIPVTLFPLPIYRKEDSPLLNPDSKIAGGEAGAEFAYEWVPARNLVMLSVATAFAEARGIDNLILGNNLEEAGAYPDNEPEFIARFNDMVPFAVGDGKSMRVLMPCGNLMKHEIVKLGHELNAPLHLTWSCYRAGRLHCGTCGPCYMRRTAFQINGLEEVIKYESA